MTNDGDPWAKYNLSPPPAGTAGAPDDPWQGYNLTPAAGSPSSTSAPGGQGWGDWALSNLMAGGKLAARVPVNVVGGIDDLAQAGGHAIDEAILNRTGGDWFNQNAPWVTKLEPGLAGHTAAPPSIAEAAIKGSSIEMDPNAGMAMRTADVALPFAASVFIPGGGASRVAEAAGGLNKAAEAARILGGLGIDYEASKEGASIGQQYGGEGGKLLGSLIGGGIRPVAARVAGAGLRLGAAAPDAGDVFDAMKDPEGPNTLPTFGQVAGNQGMQVEKALGSIPPLSWPINAARSVGEQGIAGSVAQGISKVGDRASSLTPASPEATGSRIIAAAREQNAALADAVSAQQQQLETNIGSNRPVDVSPLASTLSGLANSTAAPIARTLTPRVNDLYGSMSATPEGDLTAPYGHLKDLRSDLGVRTNAADAVPAHYLGEARDAYTSAMRDAAAQAGQAQAFNDANQAYARFKQVQEPWLERQGGALDPGQRPAEPQPGAVGARADAIPGADPGYLTRTTALLGDSVARNTLADVLSRMGRVSDRFTPSEWGKDYADVNQPTRDFIGRTGAAPYLENAALGARAFDLAPERPGLSNAMGALGAVAAGASKLPGISLGTAYSLESPALIRALAGRTDIPALLAQYALRQSAQQR
jgi:hypothetical protein